ncbi:uncharacterized protein [Amphiura filiformis]|uniref:uncharacterized protein n=1 Tax=Amphiura filiformis TaxID=82378 RepID=UPI003B221CFA
MSSDDIYMNEMEMEAYLRKDGEDYLRRDQEKAEQEEIVYDVPRNHIVVDAPAANSKGIACSSIKLCWSIVAVLVMIVISNSMTGIGLSIWYPQAFAGKDPVVICPSNSHGYASTLTVRSPAVYHFPDITDVAVSYTRHDQETITIPSSISQHTIANFTEGVTTVNLVAMDSTDNMATCNFTYARKLDSHVICPSVTPSTSTSVTFDSPKIIGFPVENSVSIFYAKNNNVFRTMLSSESKHTLNNFDIGTTLVTVTAEDASGNRASCNFSYYRIPDPIIMCPSESHGYASTITVRSPAVYNFPDTNDVTVSYLRHDQETITIPLSMSQHTIANFTEGVTTVNLVALDSAENMATCNFTYARKLDSRVICPSVTPSTSTSVIFDSPKISGFPVENSVSILYAKNNKVFRTISSSETKHTLDTFDIGSTLVTVTAEDASGNRASCIFFYHRIPDPVIICPLESQGYTSTITVKSPAVYNFPDTNDVTVSYIRHDQETITIPLSMRQHTIANFTERVTTVNLVAMDSAGNMATCNFTYARKLDSHVICPSVTPSTSTSVTFDSPKISGFPVENSVSILYTKTNNVFRTISSSESKHTLDTFDIGTTLVTVTAEDASGNRASCNFFYYRIPDPVVICPTELDGYTSTITVRSPAVYNFPDTNDVAVSYLRHDQETITIPLSRRQHTISYFTEGLTIVNLVAADSAGNMATCNFTYAWKLDAHVICPSVTPSTSTSVTFDSPKIIGFPVENSVSILYAKNNTVFRTISSSESKHTLDAFDIGTTLVTVTAEDASGNRASCNLFYYRISDPVVICSSESDVHASNLTDVAGSYIRSDQETITIPLSMSQHTIANFTEGLTIVNLVAMDSTGNMATCNFTYTRKPVPTVVCPSVPSTNNDTIRFESPMLKNFPHNELVHITYLKDDNFIMSFAATTQYHELEGFDGGTTLVTAVASDISGIVASCDFKYYRIPEVHCPKSVNYSSTAVSFPRPVANFKEKSPYYYSRNGTLFQVIAPTPTIHQHQLGDIPRDRTTNITLSVAGEFGYAAFCTFEVSYLEGSLRLVNGLDRYQGRVEIYHDGVWGTVTDDGWSSFTAPVVCRQLGLPYETAESKCCAYFGQGSGQIWMDNVACLGQEGRLDNCSHRGWGIHYDSHSEDAGVICSGEGSVRLVNGQNKYEGRVEIYHDRAWGTVCDHGWDTQDAAVVCRQLGLPVPHEAVPNYFGEGSGRIWLDEVSCLGPENRLEGCNHSEWGIVDCDHTEDAGVICNGEGSVRLVDGSNQYQGRVEVYHDGVWGTVCDDGWGTEDAAVVCRQLGLPYEAAESKSNAYFGQGSGQIWLADVRCLGQESRLDNCSHYEWGRHICSHGEDAGVACSGEGTLRLVNGLDRYQGRVEVYYNGVWGTVCDDYWDTQDAAVVCRQLGLPYEAAQSKSRAYFGQGSGQIWLDDVNCLGHENRLDNCSHYANEWGRHDCSHAEDAGVACSGEVIAGTVRLANGLDRYQGRVEIFHDGVWGTVNDDAWDSQDAAVVCHQLGLPHEAAESKSNAYFGQGSGQIWLDDVNCLGQESRMDNCSHSGWGIHSDSHSEDAGVICSGEGSLRLMDGQNRYQGRVEVYHDGVWGTVCDNGWDTNDATVVCRELGLLYEAVESKSNSYFGQGSGQIWLDEISCSGQENRLVSCNHSGWGIEDCGHNHIAWVICNLEGTVRLVNGLDQYQGRVEIYYNGIWGTVCDDEWDVYDAAVVCRQLGLPHEAAESKYRAYFGQGSGQIWLDNVDCFGHENLLDSCDHRGMGIVYNCDHGKDAGVICSNDTSEETGSPVRLVEGSSPYEGRVEIYHNNIWGSVCDTDWTTADAIVVCRQLGLPFSAAEALGSSQFGQGSGQVLLDQISCTGWESHLSSCIHEDWGIISTQCSDHSQDVGVVCKDGANYVRLVNGSNGSEGRVEILHNGEWGSICSNNWHVNESQVICRQLGLPYEATEAPVNAAFGEGIGAIWMDNVKCDGSEDNLSECDHNGWGNHTCGHDRDAGVICK